MPVGTRLTGAAVSDHPDPAVAVGEVVGHLQNSLAGSPQFALLLVDERFGPLLSTIAKTVHRLLGPDLLLALARGRPAGSDRLSPIQGSIVVWALCGVEVTAVDGRTGKRPAATGTLSPAPVMRRCSDGAVTVNVQSDPDEVTPLFISGDGRTWRASNATIRFPPGSTTVATTPGYRPLGPTAMVTDARDRFLVRVDHVAARALLVDRLDTSGAFVDGPSVEFPPLRVVTLTTSSGQDGRTIDVVAVDPDDGSIELDEPIGVGDRIRLITDDPEATGRDLVDRIVSTATLADRAVLIDDSLRLPDEPLERIATVLVPSHSRMTSPTGHRRPWTAARALLVQVANEP